MQVGHNAKWMFTFLIIAIAGGVLSTILQALGMQLFPNALSAIVLLALIALLVLHSNWQLGTKRAVTFFLLAGMLGFIFEVWGLRGGTFFGGRYVYNGNEIKFWGVPYFIPIYWSVFIYTAYTISNSFLVWLGREKPKKNTTKPALLILLVALDGILNVLLDLIMDPVQVRAGSWTWLSHGAYFGVPIGNFIGWFIVTVLATGFFRLYEYIKPAKVATEAYLLLLSVVGYCLMGLGFVASATIYGMYFISVIGIVLFVPVTIINVLLYLKKIRNIDYWKLQLR